MIAEEALEACATEFDEAANRIEANARDPHRPNIGCSVQECLDAATERRDVANTIRKFKNSIALKSKSRLTDAEKAAKFDVIMEHVGRRLNVVQHDIHICSLGDRPQSPGMDTYRLERELTDILSMFEGDV